MNIAYKNLKSVAPVGCMVLRGVAGLVQKLQDCDIDSALSGAQRGWSSQIRFENIDLEFFDPRYITSENSDAPPFFTVVQQVSHTCTGMLCIPCGQKAGNDYRVRHPAGLTMCIGANEKPDSILRRFFDETLIHFVYMLYGQKLVAPGVIIFLLTISLRLIWLSNHTS